MIRDYKQELTALLGNASAATNGSATGDRARYLRTMATLGPDTFSTFPQRLSTNRTNAYPKPGAYSELAQGLESFDVRQCSSGLSAQIDPSSPTDLDFSARVGGDVTEAEDLLKRIQQYGFGDQASTSTIPAPGCSKQAPFKPYGAAGDPTEYPQVVEQGR